MRRLLMLPIIFSFGCFEISESEAFSYWKLESSDFKGDTLGEIVSNDYMRSILKTYSFGQFSGYIEIQDHGKNRIANLRTKGFYAFGKHHYETRDISNKGKNLEDFE